MTTTATAKSPAKKISKSPKEQANGQANGFDQKVIDRWLGKTCNCRRDGSLTKRQLDVLEALSKAPADKPMTLRAIVAKIGTDWAKTVRWAIGNVHLDDDSDPFSLKARKLVKEHVVDVDGKADQLYSITAAGKAALKQRQVD